MERRRFTREFKLEAVKLIKERGSQYTSEQFQSLWQITVWSVR
jgi:transposase-like protein